MIEKDTELEIDNKIYSPLNEEQMRSCLTKMGLPLIEWYLKFGRKLPWREKPAESPEEAKLIPYHIWVSEIMLQQTRVETVIPYYERFLSAIPNISALSKADDQLLYKLWEGLGYYSRVRNLKKGAGQVMREYGGLLPADIKELKKISGIGDYTAGAIGSIAFGIREPAVDGNLMRVCSRLLAAEGDISQNFVKKKIHDLLLSVMSIYPKTIFPGDFNQAMMDLGAMVCTPQSPKCEECPINNCCLAYERDQSEFFPVKAKKKDRSIEKKTVLLFVIESKTVIRKRPEIGLLAGLWEFPMLDGALEMDDVIKYLDENQIYPRKIIPLKNAKHLFSHIEWQMRGYAVFCSENSKFASDWILADYLMLQNEYSLPSALKVYKQAAETILDNL